MMGLPLGFAQPLVLLGLVVAAFVAVGTIASLAVMLVALPIGAERNPAAGRKA